jgi:U3 small nucleolar RNA-associated protein 20
MKSRLQVVDELRQLATEVRDFVQAKIGTSDFSYAWEGLRKRTKDKRDGRREAKNRMVCHAPLLRRLRLGSNCGQVVADPQAWADRKEKRGLMKKESRKRKIKAFA